MTDESEKTRREIILDVVSDLATDFMYYDRKEDSSLGRGDIEAAIAAGEITKAEILAHFDKCLGDMQ